MVLSRPHVRSWPTIQGQHARPSGEFALAWGFCARMAAAQGYGGGGVRGMFRGAGCTAKNAKECARAQPRAPSPSLRSPLASSPDYKEVIESTTPSAPRSRKPERLPIEGPCRDRPHFSFSGRLTSKLRRRPCRTAWSPTAAIRRLASPPLAHPSGQLIRVMEPPSPVSDITTPNDTAAPTAPKR